MHHRCWEFQSQNVQIFGYVYWDTSGQNLGPTWKIQLFFLSEICTVILWQDFWERQFEKVLLKHGWEKVPNWECLFVNREKGLVLSVYVEDIKLAGKKQNIDPMWKVLVKEVDLGEATSFFDHVYLGCTQRECQTSKDIVDNYRTIFESNISAGATEKLHILIWKVMQRNAWNDIANWPTEQLNSYTKSQLHALTTINLGKEKWDALENCQKFAHKLFLECLFLARIGRPGILWSVNKLARAFTKRTRACDTCSARLISYIHHTSEFKQYCHVGNTAPECRLGLFQDWFCRRSWRLKIDLGRTYVHIRKSSYICSNKLDVQETNICLTQFNWSWDSFSWCKFTHGWDSSFLIFENWLLKCFILHLTNKRNPKTEYRETCCVTPIKQAHPKPNQNSSPARHSWIE